MSAYVVEREGQRYIVVQFRGWSGIMTINEAEEAAIDLDRCIERARDSTELPPAEPRTDGRTRMDSKVASTFRKSDRPKPTVESFGGIEAVRAALKQLGLS